MARDITERQTKILEFIKEYISNNHMPPTLREIGNNFDMQSTNGVNDHLKALERKGYIIRKKNVARGIELAQDSEVYDEVFGSSGSGSEHAFPLAIVGSVAAGKPITAADKENVEGYIMVDEQLWGGRADYALEVHGESMTGIGIMPGDYCLVKEQFNAENNQIVVAQVPDGFNGAETTVKRYKHNPIKGIVTLLSENPDYPPQEFKENEIAVIGRCVGIIRHY